MIGSGTIFCVYLRNIRVSVRWAKAGVPGVVLIHLCEISGQQWYGWAKVWKEDTVETYVSACWMQDCEEGWILISDQKAGKRRVHEYALRMRVESTFQDSKRRGWNLEASLVKEEARLDRLLLALKLRDVVGQSFSCFLHAPWQT